MQIEIYPVQFPFVCRKNILVVDPGVTTGVNALVDNVVTAIQVEAHSRWDQAEVCEWLLDEFSLRGMDYMVCEDFILEPNAPPGGRDGLSAERMLGGIAALGRFRGRGKGVLGDWNCFFQNRSLKGQIDDGRLERKGFTYADHGGRHHWRHAADCSRHLVQFVRKNGHMLSG
jgi:hypothetical protein